MKLVNRRAHRAQRLAQLLFLLPLYRNLDQRDDAERQNRHHRYRDHQLDERESLARGRGRTDDPDRLTPLADKATR